MAQDVAGTQVLSLDATDEDAPSKVFDILLPDILVLCAGAFPPVAPLREQSWQEFAVNWESDVKIAFHFYKSALSRPLPAGRLVILISSTAALAGSPNSGRYAGAKRTQFSWQTIARRNRIVLGSACNSWLLHHA
ncbi:SDR family oxidoreductase [Mesorhizobium sp. M0145]|uniref:SDR family oxidoreductase n=1 Tax=Mesorhizobium sp. M0145 TaxID=2956895 RepID=UPI00333DD8D2